MIRKLDNIYFIRIMLYFINRYIYIILIKNGMKNFYLVFVLIGYSLAISTIQPNDLYNQVQVKYKLI